MAKYKLKVGDGSGGINDLISGLYNLQSQFPEINRAAANEIAKRAVVLARDYIRDGGAPESNFTPIHEDTPDITKRLRGDDRGGGPPLNESGDLHDSIRVVLNTVAAGKIYVAIGSDEVYAAIQEYGGSPGGAISPGTIPPRPFLRPAILNAIYESVGGSLEKRIAQAYELAIKKKKWKHLF
jgi:phage gpG-like protein